ncbi:MAG: 3-deoxy-manno-octulosonate cytidylyltransferase [Proteobacteria bacterium SG_bin7]|nr:MAG: 3-deoxy-manno-octulosonate cytidylyltransferase [Proteobacteria bacterium SG_bin7]
MAKVVAVIPSRLASTRLPEKPLIKIAGKPLIQWVVEGAKRAKLIDKLVVATDSDRIAKVVDELKTECVMTSPDITTGSDRVWAAAKDQDAEFVLNVQGDEPLIRGEHLDELIAPFLKDSKLNMGTLATALEVSDMENKNVVKVIVDKFGSAIYFSRYPIPFSRIQAEAPVKLSQKHIGIYLFRKSFLQKYCEFGPTQLERAESLEQLRALYMGEKIKVISVPWDSWGVDTPEDVQKMEKVLSSRK